MGIPLRKAESGALPLLDIDVLKSFVAIAESGSFTRAARQVFRTPSALSMQIKRLEEILESPLFVREARQVSLTQEGEMLLGYARRLLRLNEEAVASFIAPPLEGTVRFGTPDDIGTRILPGVLSQFARSYPGIQVDVRVGRSADLIGQLDAGSLDMVLVTAGSRGLASGRGEVVHTERLVWTGVESGVAYQREPLPVAMAGHGCAWRAAALSALDRAGLSYRIAYISEHCAGQEAVLLADLAIAPFPRSLVQPPLRRLGDEAELPALGSYQIVLLRRDDPGAAIGALSGHVIDAFRELDESRTPAGGV